MSEYYDKEYYFGGRNPILFGGGYKNYLQFEKKHIYGWVQSYFHLARGNKILDVGGAFGLLLSQFPDSYDKTCIDISSYAIDFGKRKDKDIKFVNLSISDFRSRKKFDIILAFDVLEHVKNLEESLNKIYDLLSDGGIFMFIVPVASKFHHLLASLGVSLLNCDISHVNLTTSDSWKNYILDRRWKIIHEKKLTTGGRYVPPFHISHFFVLKKRVARRKIGGTGGN